MQKNKVYTAIGLMSGTSLDGIDCALVQTDGDKRTSLLAFQTYPYAQNIRDAVQSVLGRAQPDLQTKEAEQLITQAHINAVQDFMSCNDNLKPNIIGFHGQTIFHDPDKKKTWQIGNSQVLADQFGITVVGDMRQADIKAGGQGAPLLPLCHRAFASDAKKPMAILNLGGVGNITWLGEKQDDILAFDTGPANALIDDLVQHKIGKNYDKDGEIARKGKPNFDMIDQWLSHSYFNKLPPKSLDRNEWNVQKAYDLSLEDGAATLSEFTIKSIVVSLQHLPQEPHAIYVTGGGRHNGYIMQRLREDLGLPVHPVEDLGWNGDALEAQGFAYLAVRSMLGCPLTLPTTTGVHKPLTGGVLYQPSK